MAKRDAAMDLMGQWAPNEFAANTKDKKGLGDDLGWFPFPQVEGGAGEEGEQFGGGDGFAIGKDAPDEAVDFVKYLSSKEIATKTGGSGATLPVTEGTESSVKDPNMKAVLDARGEASFVQLYLDQAYAPAVGSAHQRRGAGALRGQGLSAGGLQEDRGCRQGRIARSSSRQGAGRVARPAPLRVRGARAGSRASRCSCCRRWCSTRCW